MCSLFATTYPERTLALVMIGTYAKRLWAADYPWAPTRAERERFFDEIREHWGGPVGLEVRAPSRAADPAFRDWWATYLRMGASPGAALTLTQMNAEIDVRHVLPAIRVPTLVLHRTDDRCLKVEEGRYVADRIPGAIVRRAARRRPPAVRRRSGRHARRGRGVPEPHLSRPRLRPRAGHGAERARRAPRPGSAAHDARLRRARAPRDRVVSRTRARTPATRPTRRPSTGRPAPSAAPRRLPPRRRASAAPCAPVCTPASATWTARACADRPWTWRARSARRPRAGEVLVSRTVKDLVAGSGLSFADRGIERLGDDPQRWRVFAAHVQDPRRP